MLLHSLKAAAAWLFAAVLMAGSAHAGLVNDVPGCYAATHIDPPSPQYEGLIYILLDQTVLLDSTLQQSVVDNTMRLIKPGTRFVIAEFSAYSQGHYLNVLHSGVMEKPLEASRVDSTPIRAAKSLEACLAQQKGFAENMVASTLADVLKASTSSLNQSDVLLSLKMVSSAVADDPAKNKVVFVVTDGLENSSVTSFYAKNSVRQIDPKAELAKAKAADLLGNFGGARVYILGGAMMPPATEGSKAQRDGYRNPQILHALSDFWHGYFSASNASLVEFGEPALVAPVSFQ